MVTRQAAPRALSITRQRPSRRATLATLPGFLGLLLAFAPITEVFAQQSEPAETAVDDAWSMPTYERLLNEVTLSEEALLLEDPGTEAWRAARQATLQTRRDLLEYVSGVLRAGNMPPELQPHAERARYLLIQNVIAASADLGLCEGIEVTLGLLQPIRSSTDPELSTAWERANTDVQNCEPVTDTASPPSDDETPALSSSNPPPPPPGRPRRTAGQITLATGLAALGAGLVWDWRSAQTTRAEFQTGYDLCDAGSPDCDYERLTDLKDTIDASRAPILALSIGGAALSVAGATMWIVDELRSGDDEQAVTLAPGSSAGPLGMTVHWRF